MVGMGRGEEVVVGEGKEEGAGLGLFGAGQPHK